MKIASRTINVTTQGFTDIIDITPHLAAFVEDVKVEQGLLTVFVGGSTGAVTTIEYEPGVVADLRRAIERLAPQSLHYDHDARWGDGNGFSHVRAALLGPSVQIPISDQRMALGTWQQVVFCDFDNKPRSRHITLQILGS